VIFEAEKRFRSNGKRLGFIKRKEGENEKGFGVLRVVRHSFRPGSIGCGAVDSRSVP
jgi:hypothetical protein